jgi:putative MATE family efflux protein
LRVPPEATGEAWAYMKVCLYGVVFTMGYSLISSILRSLGNSKAPFYFILVSCGVNILLDYVFVGVLRLAAAGAALATVIAQTLSFLVSLAYILKKKLPFAFSLKDVKPSAPMIRRILKIGVPVSLQSSLNTVSFIVIMAIANSMGLYVSAATSVVFGIANLFLIIPVAFGSAIAAITAQNIGAKKPERAMQSMWLGLLISLLVLVPVFIVMSLFPRDTVSIITKDPNVIRESVRFLYPNIMDSVFVCFIFCFYGFFNGCGKTLFVMLSETLAAFLVRIPVSYLMKVLIADSTIFHVGLGTPIASFVTFVACLVYMRLKFSKDKLRQLDVVH